MIGTTYEILKIGTNLFAEGVARAETEGREAIARSQILPILNLESDTSRVLKLVTRPGWVNASMRKLVKHPTH
ncbi:MAG: hypothetical protein SW833_07715 [Cyanobacteriota bacterium]|nr:hypothetical protein [Cyanobacteriota bacterium]